MFSNTYLAILSTCIEFWQFSLSITFYRGVIVNRFNKLIFKNLFLISLTCIFYNVYGDDAKSTKDIQAGSSKLACVADVSIASFSKGGSVTAKDNEQGSNSGKSERLKIKKYENQPLLKFDFSSVPNGATITEAWFEIVMLENKPLNQVGVCTMHVDWNEGDGLWNDDGVPDLKHEGACFVGPKGIKSVWSKKPEGDFNHVVAGLGGNATCFSKAVSLGDGKWKIPVDAYVVMAARQHGQSFVLTDETGIFDGPLGNGFLCSRHVAGKEPVLIVNWQNGRDQKAPSFKETTEIVPGPYAGSVVIQLAAAGDDGAEGNALGYQLFVDGVELSRVDIPRPSRKLRGILIRDLPPGKEIEFKIIAFDEANNTVEQIVKSKTREVFTSKLIEPLYMAPMMAEAPVTNKTFTVRLIDGETLLDPLSDKITPKQLRVAAKDGVLAEKVNLNAIRGEILGAQLQIILQDGNSELKDIKVEVSDLKTEGGIIPQSQIEFFREHFVKVKEDWIADILPIVKKDEKLSIPSQNNLSNQKSLIVYVDLIVPSDAKTGIYQGVFKVSSGELVATKPFTLIVRNLVMPDSLSFTVEMNAYGHNDDKKIFHETYRLCHKHRLSYNPLGYGHTRATSLCTPKLNQTENPEELKIVDWSLYDEFYGPILSGAIAADLPRKNIPATHFYLPFHDSWPYSLQKCVPQLFEGRVALGAKPDKDKKEKYMQWVNHLAANDLLVGQHLDKNWQTALQVVAKQFREHFKEKGWALPKMQIFNNHKYYFANGSQSLWTMDEPQYGRDFRALNYMKHLQDKALSGDGINTQIRIDVSRPEHMGDKLDDTRVRNGIEGLYVVSSAINSEKYLIAEMLATSHATLWWYGGGSGAESDPCSVPALFLSRWGAGASGGMPVYMVEGGSNKWTDTDSLRVIRYYEDTKLPLASFRMKAYRRGQQDIELLNMLSNSKGFNKQWVDKLLESEISLKQITISTNPDDPGYTTFEGLDSSVFDKIREKVIATILAINSQK